MGQLRQEGPESLFLDIRCLNSRPGGRAPFCRPWGTVIDPPGPWSPVGAGSTKLDQNAGFKVNWCVNSPSTFETIIWNQEYFTIYCESAGRGQNICYIIVLLHFLSKLKKIKYHFVNNTKNPVYLSRSCCKRIIFLYRGRQRTIFSSSSGFSLVQDRMASKMENTHLKLQKQAWILRNLLWMTAPTSVHILPFNPWETKIKKRQKSNLATWFLQP